MTHDITAKRLKENKFLQASHHIIQWLEESKFNSDLFIDESAEVFCVVERNGRILRGNRRFARMFSLDMEELLGKPLQELLSKKVWEFFDEKIKFIRDPDNETTVVAFELPIVRRTDSRELVFLWSVREFTSRTDPKQRYYALSGRDMTAIREYEKRFATIYATIPVGVLHAGEGLCVADMYSSYTEVLLNTSDIRGRSLMDLLFKPAWELLSPQERQQASLLESMIGRTDREFDAIRHKLLRRVFLPSPNSPTEGRWLALTYAPITLDHVVRSILVVIQDRSE